MHASIIFFSLSLMHTFLGKHERRLKHYICQTTIGFQKVFMSLEDSYKFIDHEITP